jgi:hypothetical protein
MKSNTFWDVTPCRLVEYEWHGRNVTALLLLRPDMALQCDTSKRAVHFNLSQDSRYSDQDLNPYSSKEKA